MNAPVTVMKTAGEGGPWGGAAGRKKQNRINLSNT